MAWASFMPRAEAEKDECFRQIIPYVVLRPGERVHLHARNRRAKDPRLPDLRSAGAGGHVTPSDLPGALAGFVATPRETLAVAARRELAEEVAGAPADAPLEWIGF